MKIEQHHRRIAPSWIITVKASQLPFISPSACSAVWVSNRCPVEETGMNSVSPSTIPNTIAVNQSGMAAPLSLPSLGYA